MGNNMAIITYNSWSEQYKRPFGALLLGTTLTLDIQTETQHQTMVQLVLQFENNEKSYQPLTEVSKGCFQIVLTQLTQIGYYRYYFQIIESDGSHDYLYYYGATDIGGGLGTTYLDENEVVPYTQTIFSKSEQAPDWYRQAVFYQIFPDAFARSGELSTDKDNIFLYGKTSDAPFYIKDTTGDIMRWSFYGGNLRGIIEKIPYLKSLGITALYLNPIFEARSPHRYDTSDYLKIDSLLGNASDFKQLVEALHTQNMHLVLDGVFSHVGRNSIYFDFDGQSGGQGAYQTINSPYSDWFTFNHYPDDYQSWWGIKDLPTIDKSQAHFRDFIYGDGDSVINHWNQLGIDGWRLDVADELPDDFIRGIRHRLDTFSDQVLIGEVWEDASRKIAYEQHRKYIYGDGLQATMNYPFRDLIIGLVMGKISPETAAKKVMQLSENYPTDIFMNNFNNIGTHDTTRILTELQESHDKLELAVGLLMSLPGVPCVYYGDEAGLTGQKDPENRAFFPWDKRNESIYAIYRYWIKLRHESSALKEGQLALFYSEKVFGIIRETQTETAVIMFNCSDQSILVDANDVTFLTKKVNFKAVELDANKSSFHLE